MSFARQHSIGKIAASKKGINPANASAGTTNGAAIDRQGRLSCILHHACGAASGSPTAQTVDAKLQESADGSTSWTDISSAAATQLTADNTEAEVNVDLGGVKRYIRVVSVVGFTGGTSPEIPVAATVTLGGGDEPPI